MAVFIPPSFRLLNQLLFLFTPYCTKTIKNPIHFNKSFYKDLKKILLLQVVWNPPTTQCWLTRFPLTPYFTFQGPESPAGNGRGSHLGGLQSHRMSDGHQLHHHEHQQLVSVTHWMQLQASKIWSTAISSQALMSLLTTYYNDLVQPSSFQMKFSILVYCA